MAGFKVSKEIFHPEYGESPKISTIGKEDKRM
jgi:hypothetical protein